MNDAASRKWIDVGVTLVLMGVGVYGLVTALGFPSRAGIWPISVMALLIVATAVHLVLTLRSRGEDAASPAGDGE